MTKARSKYTEEEVEKFTMRLKTIKSGSQPLELGRGS